MIVLRGSIHTSINATRPSVGQMKAALQENWPELVGKTVMFGEVETKLIGLCLADLGPKKIWLVERTDGTERKHLVPNKLGI